MLQHALNYLFYSTLWLQELSAKSFAVWGLMSYSRGFNCKSFAQMGSTAGQKASYKCLLTPTLHTWGTQEIKKLALRFICRSDAHISWTTSCFSHWQGCVLCVRVKLGCHGDCFWAVMMSQSVSRELLLVHPPPLSLSLPSQHVSHGSKLEGSRMVTKRCLRNK